MLGVHCFGLQVHLHTPALSPAATSYFEVEAKHTQQLFRSISGRQPYYMLELTMMACSSLKYAG